MVDIAGIQLCINIKLGHPLIKSVRQPVSLGTRPETLDYLFDACYKKIEFPSFQAIQTKER